MRIYKTDFDGKTTFRLIPMSKSCPFIDIIYNINEEILIIISKDKKENPILLPANNNEKEIIMDTYYEYYIEDKDDIKKFVESVAINPEHELLKILE